MKACATKASLLLAAAAICVLAPAAFAAGKATVWKPFEQAVFRIDDRPAPEWNLYQSGKKNDPVLLQLGQRFLLIEIHDHRIFEIDPARITHKDTELLWDPTDRPAKPLETSEWVQRDIGLAYKLGVRLEGRLFDLQIPHPLDIRSIVR